MKTIIHKFLGIFILFTVVALTTGCTSEFEDINTDPYNVYDSQLEADFQVVGGRFSEVLRNIYIFSPVWTTQVQQNLNADVFSGYMMPPTPFEGNSNNMTYNLIPGWNTFAWNVAYENVMGPLRAADLQAEALGFDSFLAWSKICKVAAMHRVSDIYGPIIYTQFGNLDVIENYDCQENVYDAFFTDLDDAISTLTPLAKELENSTVTPFTRFDISDFRGSYVQWIRFANSLRLRLALRISGVNPNRAREEAEAAVGHEFGVLSNSLTDNFQIPNANHPLNTINNSWNDIRMGAPMESILVGYNDPRLALFFQPSEVSGGEYKGIRQGIEIVAKEDYQSFSKLANLNYVVLMTVAEVFFLRAEGVLNGWDMGGGSAQDYYEQGIQASFDQHGLSNAPAYYNNSSSRPMDYVDPANAANNIPAATDITIQWQDTDPEERKLERIITQKWIAMYPEGQEAWSEFRRTGYPRLFPVVINDSPNGQISTDEFIKRLPFAQSDVNTNPAGVAAARNCQEIGGQDHGGTALWWDVN